MQTKRRQLTHLLRLSLTHGLIMPCLHVPWQAPLPLLLWKRV